MNNDSIAAAAARRSAGSRSSAFPPSDRAACDGARPRILRPRRWIVTTFTLNPRRLPCRR